MGPYRYVGPDHIRAAASGAPGLAITSAAALDAWLGGQERIATFVISLDGTLRVADRRSEHVACAGGEPVLAAGEMSFAPGPIVVGVSNLSTGYCPEPSSFPEVARALDAAGIPHPGRYGPEIIFRRCPACGERNVVKDDDFTCAICDAELPRHWNF